MRDRSRSQPVQVGERPAGEAWSPMSVGDGSRRLAAQSPGRRYRKGCCSAVYPPLSANANELHLQQNEVLAITALA